jgi:hypothetical protein
VGVCYAEEIFSLLDSLVDTLISQFNLTILYSYCQNSCHVVGGNSHAMLLGNNKQYAYPFYIVYIKKEECYKNRFVHFSYMNLGETIFSMKKRKFI